MKVVEQYREVKDKLVSLASYIKEEGILSENEFNEVLETLSKDKIKIGVAGQMKYGKSTLINALLFKRRVLPTSDIPMTAKLTFIEYGDKESYVVEFFSKEEWETIKEVARASGDEKEQQVFRKILEQARVMLGSNVDKFLGKKVEVSKEELYDYVGADGKYTPITKALYIKLLHEVLKELMLVDTPGFNDPVESREREAEKFLQEADALIFLLYADRALDATDRDLLITKIAQFGTGGIILVLNKYDLLFEREGALDKVKEYVNRVIDSIINDKNLGDAIRKVLKEAPFVYVSALWALLGSMPESEFSEDDKWYFEKYKNELPFLKTKEDFLEHSRLKELEEKLLEVVKHRKINILVNKVKGLLEGSIIKREVEVEDKILSRKAEEKLLNEGKEKLEERKRKFEDFKKWEFPKIVDYGNTMYELHTLIQNAERDIRNELKKIFDGIKFEEIGLIDFGGFREKVRGVVLNAYIQAKDMIRNKLDTLNERCKEKLKRYIEETINELLDDRIVRDYTNLLLSHEETLKKNLTERLRRSISIEVPEISTPNIGERFLFFGESAESAKNKAYEYKDKAYEKLLKVLKNLMYQYENDRVKSFLEEVSDTLKESVIKPIEEAIERAEESLRDKEKRLRELAQELEELNKEKERLGKIKEKLNAEISKLGDV